MPTVFGLFDSYYEANQAVRTLDKAGFDHESISVLGQEKIVRTDEAETEESMMAGAATGATIGGIAGLIAGIAGMTIPGIGPLLGTGILASTIGSTIAGTGVGLAAGGLIGALTEAGASEEYATMYEDAIKNGKVLVAIEAPAKHVRVAEDILINEGAHEVHYQTQTRAQVR